MAVDYAKGLKNIENRRFDRELNESVLTRSFSDSGIPENIKYLWESMKPIPEKSNNRTIEAANRVRDHLESKLNLHFRRDYRTQGSVMTQTNIAVHSDYDLLAIIKRYHYVLSPLTITSPYNDSDPDVDIVDLRSQSEKILKDIYDDVDCKGSKSIKITNKSLNRKVDVVFAFWCNTKAYEDSNDEIHRGLYLYDFDEKKRICDFPFNHIYHVNVKGDSTNDGSRRAIRLMKNVKGDSDQKIDLSSFHITTIAHSVDNSKLLYTPGRELEITKAISDQLGILIGNASYRSQVKSPNSTETPLTQETVSEMQKMKNDLDVIIKDALRELASSMLQRKVLAY